jgi:hypothetical protein
MQDKIGVFAGGVAPLIVIRYRKERKMVFGDSGEYTGITFVGVDLGNG